LVPLLERKSPDFRVVGTTPNRKSGDFRYTFELPLLWYGLTLGELVRNLTTARINKVRFSRTGY
jgi:hypothetical protein